MPLLTNPRAMHFKLAELEARDRLSAVCGTYVITACGLVVDYQRASKNLDAYDCIDCDQALKSGAIHPGHLDGLRRPT